MIAAVLVAFTFGGIALIFGLCIADMIEHRRHTRWIEANNRRRHGIA